MLDYKITKKHYPRTNTHSVLEFIFEKDPNLFLKKNKILIRGSIEIDDKYVLENGWVSKLFSMLTVEVDSQTVSTNKNRYFRHVEMYITVVLAMNTFWLIIFISLAITILITSQVRLSLKVMLTFLIVILIISQVRTVNKSSLSAKGQLRNMAVRPFTTLPSSQTFHFYLMRNHF